MSRITGKNAKLQGVLARTTISVAEVMTDGGAHTLYTLTGKPYWNPNIPPAITRQLGGAGPFLAVSPNEYTVDYIAGSITFSIANAILDVIKVNGIEWMTLQNVGDLFNWTLDAKLDVVDATAFQDSFKTHLSSFRGWMASADSYHVSGYWFDAFATDRAEFYVSFYVDAAGSEHYVGAAFIDNAIDVKKDSAVTEKMKMTGTGKIARVP